MKLPNEIDLFDEYNPEVSIQGEKLKALDELFFKSAKYKNSKEYLSLLKFINRFPKISPFNAFLIHAQNSGVQVVLSAKQWEKQGRKIKYNARPLVILIPFGPVNFVYDIADTEGADIPDYLINPFSTTGNLNPSIYHQTVISCEKEMITIIEYDMHKASAGYAKEGALKI